MEAFQGIPGGIFTPIGAICLVLALPYILIARGLLVPRKSVDDLVTSYDKQLENVTHDRDEWRAAHRISETARVEEREHNAALLADVVAPLKGFLEGFRQAAARGGEGQ